MYGNSFTSFELAERAKGRRCYSSRNDEFSTGFWPVEVAKQLELYLIDVYYNAYDAMYKVANAQCIVHILGSVDEGPSQVVGTATLVWGSPFKELITRDGIITIPNCHRMIISDIVVEESITGNVTIDGGMFKCYYNEVLSPMDVKAVGSFEDIVKWGKQVSIHT